MCSLKCFTKVLQIDYDTKIRIIFNMQYFWGKIFTQ